MFKERENAYYDYCLYLTRSASCFADITTSQKEVTTFHSLSFRTLDRDTTRQIAAADHHHTHTQWYSAQAELISAVSLPSPWT